MLVFLCLSSCAEKSEVILDGKAVSNLYKYSRQQISRKLIKLGFGNFDFNEIERDAAGRTLYIKEVPSSGNRIVAISLTKKPYTLVQPTAVSALDSHERFLFWSDNIQRGITLRSGATVQIAKPFGRYGSSPDGRFFFFESAEDLTEIISVADESKTIAEAPFSGDRIFAKDRKIFLFGIKREGEITHVLCTVFSPSANGYIQIDSYAIPRVHPGPAPYYVNDMDQSSNLVVLTDVHDPPFSSRLCLFDLRTRKLSDLGTAKSYAFFLQDDIVRKCLE
jgi:hypothetical protein